MYSLSNSQKEQNFLRLHQVSKKRFSLVRKTNKQQKKTLKKTPSTHILWSQPPLRCHWRLGTRHKLLIRPHNVPGLWFWGCACQGLHPAPLPSSVLGRPFNSKVQAPLQFNDVFFEYFITSTFCILSFWWTTGLDLWINSLSLPCRFFRALAPHSSKQ